MNKTVNINLSGIIFHIEEDAYGKLHSYLSTIKGYFSESEGRDEIMADIENRIAEMLSEKISDKKQVVLVTDVDRVIEVMGKPEDFAGEQTQGEATKKEHPIYSTSGKRRRVFRDPDNRILGGVCSGIANYFNIDPLWLRLALVVSLFAFGTGFLLYIVLWIVIPEAQTAAEKLEMRGEDVNFSNIGKKVEEEINSFGKKAEKWGEEVKQNAHTRKAESFIRRFVDFIVSMFGAFFRVFGKLLGLFFVIIGLIILVSIFISLFFSANIINIENHSISLPNLFYTFSNDSDQIIFTCIAAILFFGVPLIMLLYGGFRLLLGVKKGNRFLNFTAVILWLIGLGMMIIAFMTALIQFSEKTSSKQPFALTQSKCDTLFLRMKEIKGWNKNHKHSRKHFRMSIGFPPLMLKHDILSTDSQNICFGVPAVNIVRSETDSIEIVVYNKARGKNRKEALYFAKNILYDISQNDSLIEFTPYFSVPKDEKWRNQQVYIEVRVPKEKMVYLYKNMKHLIYDIGNETDTYDGDMVGRRWIMGEDELRCVDCEGLTKKRVKKNKKEKIMIGTGGINIESEGESIKIGHGGIHIETPDKSIKMSKDGIIEKENN